MKLPGPSIRKLFRETFPGNDPIVVAPEDFASQTQIWRDRIAAIDGVQLSAHAGDSDARAQTLCRFTIPEPGNQTYYYRGNEIRLKVDDQRRLVITTGQYGQPEQSAHVESCEEVETLVTAVQRRYARRRTQTRRRSQVLQFKRMAFAAQVRKILAAFGYHYAIVDAPHRWQLFVRLTDDHLACFDVPHQNYEPTVAHLGDAVEQLRRWHEAGVRFQTSSNRRLPYGVSWSDPTT